MQTIIVAARRARNKSREFLEAQEKHVVEFVFDRGGRERQTEVQLQHTTHINVVRVSKIMIRSG